MKTDFGGHRVRHSYNIYGYVGQGFSTGGTQYAGENDEFTNNTLVLTTDLENYGAMECNDHYSEYVILGDNVVSTPSGDPSKTGLCNMNEANFQKTTGLDGGTTINPLPDDTDLLNQAKNMLWS